MSTPDVRVRLSAEGVQEVVGALKKIQSEGQKAGAKGNAAFGGLRDTLSSVSGLLGTIGIGFGALSTMRFFKDLTVGSISAATAMVETADRAGLSARHLSRWSAVVESTGGSAEAVTKSLRALSREMKATGDTRSLDEAFVSAIGYLQTIPDEATRNVESQRLLGRSYEDLGGVIRMSAEQLEMWLELVRRSGAEVSDTLGVQARATDTALDIIGIRWKGLKNTIAEALLLRPEVISFLNAVAATMPSDKEWTVDGRHVGYTRPGELITPPEPVVRPVYGYERYEMLRKAAEAARAEQERFAERWAREHPTPFDPFASEHFMPNQYGSAVGPLLGASQYERPIGPVLDETTEKIQTLGEAVRDTATDDLANWFDQGIAGAKGFGDAVRGLASSILASLRSLSSQALASGLFRSFGFGPAEEKASGGLVLGPGTGVSDSIPAYLSRGEFVVRAAAVQQPGVLDLLTTINRGMATPALRRIGPRRGFAEGGLVSSSSAGGGGGESRLVVGLETGLVLRALESREGQKVLVQMIAKNRRAVARVTG